MTGVSRSFSRERGRLTNRTRGPQPRTSTRTGYRLSRQAGRRPTGRAWLRIRHPAGLRTGRAQVNRQAGARLLRDRTGPAGQRPDWPGDQRDWPGGGQRPEWPGGDQRPDWPGGDQRDWPGGDQRDWPGGGQRLGWEDAGQRPARPAAQQGQAGRAVDGPAVRPRRRARSAAARGGQRAALDRTGDRRCSTATVARP